MLVIIKNAPNTPEGKRAIRLARDMAADICLLQNAVYFAQKDRLEGFCGAVFVLDEDMKLRGLKSEDMEKGIKVINYDELVDLIIKEDKVIGVF
jgi:sulfur relay protein TusB/DsrH